MADHSDALRLAQEKLSEAENHKPSTGSLLNDKDNEFRDEGTALYQAAQAAALVAIAEQLVELNRHLQSK